MPAGRSHRSAVASGLVALTLLSIVGASVAAARSATTIDGADPASSAGGVASASASATASAASASASASSASASASPSVSGTSTDDAAALTTTTGGTAADATVDLTAGTVRYATLWVSIRTAADDDAAVEVTVGPRYKVVLTGATASADGVTWLQVTWTSPSRHGTGWIPASASSTTRPAGTNASASVNALSTTLAAYLAGYGSKVGVEVLDVTRNVVYTADASGTFITASSVKVPIMLAVMARAEAAHRSLTSAEKSLLTAMIERSDNSAASTLYARIGGRAGLVAWARKFGISGLVPEGAGRSWGYTTIHPSTMVAILERLRLGRLTNATDRTYALSLMRHVISTQRFGVGTGSPTGATVEMKNGWVPGPDGLWAVNSSGIVICDGETYVISVYTRANTSFSAGNAIVTHVASVIGAALT